MTRLEQFADLRVDALPLRRRGRSAVAAQNSVAHMAQTLFIFLIGIHAAILPCRAQERSMTWVHAGVAAHVTGSALDAYTAWGGCEGNPILGQRFGPRGLAIKTATTGGSAAFSYWAARKWPSGRRYIGVLNLAVGAGYGFIAYRNFRIK